MIINNETITTPLDDPVGYHLDWRSRVAKSCYKDLTKLPAALQRDQDIRAYVAHLRLRDRQPVGVNGVKPLDRLLGWRTSPLGRLLEASLLTQATLGEIGTSSGVDEADVRQYGRLWYAVRDDNEKPISSVLRRLRAELRSGNGVFDTLKRTALMAGTPGLENLLDGSKSDDLGALVDVELKRRLVAGELRNNDLISLQRNQFIRERLPIDSKPVDADMRAMAASMMALLSASAPHLVMVEKTEAEHAVMNTEIQGRIDSQSQAMGVPVSVTVPGEGDFDRLIQRRIGGERGA